MKYIIHIGACGLEEIEIFCEVSNDQHDTRAEKLGILDKVVSAGFLKFDDSGAVRCGGFSRTLSDKLGRDICSRGELDEKIFNRHNKTSMKVIR
jgi:hypothetical protein